MADPTAEPLAPPADETAILGAPVSNGDIETVLKSRIASSKRVKKQLYAEWKNNVELRIGHTPSSYTSGLPTMDDGQTEINPDWSLTKTKTANLYSQVPAVQCTHENEQYKAAIAPFAKALNYEIGEKRANIGVPMEEVLNDCVNAAGVGVMLVEYAARFETVQVPKQDMSHLPPQQVQALVDQQGIPTQPVQKVTSDRFSCSRVSPTDFLWPADFTGSNFDDADFAGRTGRCSWAVAKNDFKLKDEQKVKVVTGVEGPHSESLRSDPDQAAITEASGVKFDELFYWRYRVDPDEKSFQSIWRVVFVHGLDEPVIHEPWKGQRLDPTSGKYVGATKFPIRVLTLTYITDNPIPPSDSRAGRPQVNDLRKSRAQMFMNRERSIPIRWFDTNRIDTVIQDSLMRGQWQAMIPTNGDGSRSIGEIARASYPSEDFSFDAAAKSDLMDTWQVGPNQNANISSGRKTSAEVQITQSNFSTRIGQERNRVAYFFLGAVMVMAGLMALYSEFPSLTDQERQAMQAVWNDKQITHDLVLKIRPDSTIVLEPAARLQKLSTFLNLTVKSGFINPQPIIAEMAELSGIDPSEVMIQPQPKPPSEPNISYRFTGKDDLVNPLVLAVLIKAGHAPSPQEIDAAKQLLVSTQQPPTPPAPPGMASGAPGAPGTPPSAPGGPQGPPSPPTPPQSHVGAPAAPPVPHPATAAAHEDWQLASKVAQRSRDI